MKVINWNNSLLSCNGFEDREIEFCNVFNFSKKARRFGIYISLGVSEIFLKRLWLCWKKPVVIFHSFLIYFFVFLWLRLHWWLIVFQGHLSLKYVSTFSNWDQIWLQYLTSWWSRRYQEGIILAPDSVVVLPASDVDRGDGTSGVASLNTRLVGFIISSYQPPPVLPVIEKPGTLKCQHVRMSS